MGFPTTNMPTVFQIHSFNNRIWGKYLLYQEGECLLSLWSICTISSLLTTPCFPSVSQIPGRFLISPRTPVGEPLRRGPPPVTSHLSLLTFNFKDHWNSFHKCLPSKTLLGWKGTSVNKTEMKPCGLGLLPCAHTWALEPRMPLGHQGTACGPRQPLPPSSQPCFHPEDAEAGLDLKLHGFLLEIQSCLPFWLTSPPH